MFGGVVGQCVVVNGTDEHSKFLIKAVSFRASSHCFSVFLSRSLCVFLVLEATLTWDVLMAVGMYNSLLYELRERGMWPYASSVICFMNGTK